MKEVVVLVHGIWVNGLEQSLLRHRLRRCGYDCRQFSYHSLLRTPAQNAERLQAVLQKIDADVVHFVAHSLGGVVLHHLFDRYPEQRSVSWCSIGSTSRTTVPSACTRHARLL